jgi:hypothetical protein
VVGEKGKSLVLDAIISLHDGQWKSFGKGAILGRDSWNPGTAVWVKQVVSSLSKLLGYAHVGCHRTPFPLTP